MIVLRRLTLFKATYIYGSKKKRLLKRALGKKENTEKSKHEKRAREKMAVEKDFHLKK